MEKKGQGLPLNVIVIAVIVLAVLVVLLAVFLKNIGSFDKSIGEQSKLELLKFRPSYGSCKPTASEEQNFLSKLDEGQKANDVNAQAGARTSFQTVVSDCARRTSADCSGTCTSA